MGYTYATLIEAGDSRLVYYGHWNFGLWVRNHKILSFTYTSDMPERLLSYYVDAICIQTELDALSVKSAILTAAGIKSAEYHAKGK